MTRTNSIMIFLSRRARNLDCSLQIKSRNYQLTQQLDQPYLLEWEEER